MAVVAPNLGVFTAKCSNTSYGMTFWCVVRSDMAVTRESDIWGLKVKSNPFWQDAQQYSGRWTRIEDTGTLGSAATRTTLQNQQSRSAVPSMVMMFCAISDSKDKDSADRFVGPSVTDVD